MLALHRQTVNRVSHFGIDAELRKAWRWRRHMLASMLSGLVIMLVLSACAPVVQTPSAAAYPAEVAVAWFDLTQQLIRSTPGYSPPVAARSLGYMGVTLYETVRPGMPGYLTLAGQLNELKELPAPDPMGRFHWPSAVNRALAAQARAFFPTAPAEQQAAIDQLEERYRRQFEGEIDATTRTQSEVWGDAVASAIFDWSRSDGGHEGYMTNFAEGYDSPKAPGLWAKTPPAFSAPLQPYWGDNRPFALTDAAACPAPEPPAYSEEQASTIYREAYEVYSTVARHDSQAEEIARFWSDDPGRTATPPGHWLAILGQVLVQDDAGLDRAAEGYAKLGISVADAFITCWHTKYIYNVMRPITYIQQVIDPAWNADAITDPVITPPFPEYTSGHSVQSAAAALVLTDLFGEGYAFTDHTHDRLGLAPRSFASFADAAQEAAISRLYGGIHYRSAIEQGLEQGRCVGEQVLAVTWQAR